MQGEKIYEGELKEGKQDGKGTIKSLITLNLTHITNALIFIFLLRERILREWIH